MTLRLAALAQGRARVRRFHLRASTFALRAPADKSRYGGQFAATARQARLCLATALFVAIAGGTRVLACPMCFGAEETSMVDGTKLGVLVLLAITLAVQGGFVGFFLYLRKRAKRIADIELDAEWSELQGVSRTS
jgi:hypothetical protein